MKNLKDKVAVITGAGRGIGRGIALHCAQQGMQLVLADIQGASVTQTAGVVRGLGAEALVVQTDVSRSEDVENLADKSYAKFGAVDLLVNNAGVAAPATVLGSSLDDWNWVMGVNFYGVLHGIRAFVPRMIEQGTAAQVVNIASLAGVVEAVDSYHVSKHAVVALTESLYHDLADSAPQIKVSIFLPGLVNTELYRAEDSRPPRFRGAAVRPSTTQEREASRGFFRQYGYTIQGTVGILFEGLAQEKFYIGPEAFLKQSPKILESIRRRAENIASERNPDHPAETGPVNPV